MLVKEIRLNNYRNYDNLNIPLDPYLNIIIGPNGVGKTNILESIIVISNTKSFRTTKDIELIKKNTNFSKIELETSVDKFKIVVNNEGKTLFINDNNIKKTSEFIGKLNAILFKPSDLELFSSSPKERRKVLDVELGKISKTYLNNLLTYNHLLKDKNKLLKENIINNIYLDLIDNKMKDNIKEIIIEREEFFNNINKYISNIYQKVSNTNDEIKIIYKKCCEIEDIENNLFISRDKDLIYRYAIFGPHHDDYYFTFNNYELNSIASQGQKRMVYIAFKLALIIYIENKTKEKPIILLDDVLSELDINNRNRLLDILPNDCQIVITDTDIKDIKIEKDYKLIELKEVNNG